MPSFPVKIHPKAINLRKGQAGSRKRGKEGAGRGQSDYVPRRNCLTTKLIKILSYNVDVT